VGVTVTNVSTAPQPETPLQCTIEVADSFFFLFLTFPDIQDPSEFFGEGAWSVVGCLDATVPALPPGASFTHEFAFTTHTALVVAVGAFFPHTHPARVVVECA
jgi:hypothetical protein